MENFIYCAVIQSNHAEKGIKINLKSQKYIFFKCATQKEKLLLRRKIFSKLLTMHSFPLRISSVNVSKSAVFFFTFFVQCKILKSYGKL